MNTTAAVLLGSFLLALARPAGAGDILGPQRLAATLKTRQCKSWVISMRQWVRIDTLVVKQRGHRMLILAVLTPNGQLICQQRGDGAEMQLAWDPGRYSDNTYLVRVWNWSTGPAVTVTLETPK